MFLTTTASAVVPSVLMTAGVLLITAVVRGAWMVLASCANSGCFFRMCCTILVWDTKETHVISQPVTLKVYCLIQYLPCCCTVWHSAGNRQVLLLLCQSAECAYLAWGLAHQEQLAATFEYLEATLHQDGSSGCELSSYWHFCIPETESTCKK